MKRKLAKKSPKLSLLLIKLAVCYEIFASSSTQAFILYRTPEGTQLLPPNLYENSKTLQNDSELKIKQPCPNKNTSTSTLYVRQIKIVGNTVFDTDILHALLKNGEGKTLTLNQLNQLNQLVACISHYYQQNGYPFSRAYIPAQCIKNNVVQFNILEARYGDIRIKNLSRLTTYLANRMLNPLHINDRVEASKLLRSLLLLNDLPGIKASSSIGPGQAPGSSDLEVLIKPSDLMNGFIGIDNYGSPYTGRPRYSASLQFNNPTGGGRPDCHRWS